MVEDPPSKVKKLMARLHAMKGPESYNEDLKGIIRENTGQKGDIKLNEGADASNWASAGTLGKAAAPKLLAKPAYLRTTTDPTLLASELVDGLGDVAKGMSTAQKAHRMPYLEGRYNELTSRGYDQRKIVELFVEGKKYRGYQPEQITSALSRLGELVRQIPKKVGGTILMEK